ncbi:MAG: AraC family transcriptional regulator, partial [Bacteroidota bacterium]
DIMILERYNIPERFDKYVAELLYHKNYFPVHDRDKYLPDGTINIVFELTGNAKFIFDNITGEQTQKCEDVWFSGVLKDYITISSHHEEMIVLAIKPGAGFSLIHSDVSEYTNKVVPAVNVFGDSIANLLDKLKQSSTLKEKFLAIEVWLDKQLKADDFYTSIIKFTIDAIEKSPTQISISQLKRKSGYSEKQFIQIFKKYVGITPKQFHRIVRFNEILSMVEREEAISWTHIATTCGYYDQAHFIRDFRHFSGINPKKYLKHIGDYPNFYPIK